MVTGNVLLTNYELVASTCDHERRSLLATGRPWVFPWAWPFIARLQSGHAPPIGPDSMGLTGSGVSLDKQPLPATWSETENLKWKAKLPGPGSSSPIVVGQRVVVTCWTGYGADPANEGEEKDLRRHVSVSTATRARSFGIK